MGNTHINRVVRGWKYSKLVNGIMLLYMIDRIRLFFKKPEKAFIVLAFIFGVGFLITIPPLQTPDEIAHFYRSYQVATGQWLLNKNEKGHSVAWMPESVPKTVKTLAYNSPVAGDSNKEYDLQNTRHALSVRLEKNKQKLLDAGSAAGHTPLVYAPQGITLSILNLFNARPLIMIYAVRIAVLLTWIFLAYFAIKLLPKRRWALVGILLIPMMSAQSISPGVDAIAIGFGILFISLIFNLRKEKIGEASNKKKSLLVLSAIMMVLAKPVMACVLPIVYYMRQKKTQKEKLFIVMTLILPIVVYLLWSKLLSSNVWSLPEGVAPGDQLKNLIIHPWNFFVVFFNTFFFQWGDGVISSLIGNFGPLDTPLSQPFVVIGFLLLAFYVFVSYEKEGKLPNRWIIVALLIVYLFAVCLAMYLVYTPVGFGIFYGLQGRYFLAIPIVLVMSGCLVFLNTSRKIYKNIALLGSVALLSISIITVIFRYYIDYNI